MKNVHKNLVSYFRDRCPSTSNKAGIPSTTDLPGSEDGDPSGDEVHGPTYVQSNARERGERR
jgi:hypothetical protein